MSATILLVDDEDNFRQNYAALLTAKGYEVIGVATLEAARTQIAIGAADIILLDVYLPDGYGPVLLNETANLPMRPPIILFTNRADVENAVEAMKNGAHDYLEKPIRLPQLEQSIQRAIDLVQMRRELNHYRQERQQQFDYVVGQNPKMKLVYAHAQRAAEVSASVLITGETGTGKEVLAHAIHSMGDRANKPFIPINCAAIQSTMLESELFGHEAGAFTSAEKRKPGLMEIADGGVLFLDEIASMPLDMQAKLLRALDEHAFRRVGGTQTIKVDVQILAASNRHLPTLLTEGQFRQDLYYRLKVVDLFLPPLREHKEDIPELVGMFIRKNNRSMGINILDITPRALHALIRYSWPGNIRELRNVIERAMLFCDEPSIDTYHLPSELNAI